jgi:4-amino-4-deoxy-L-arabinose transferase-like glycosyltransferase
MFVMLATPYFIKYTSHGMTDVPFTFFFTAAICAWILAAEKPAWYTALALFCGSALLTRGVVGSVVLVTLGVDLLRSKRTNKSLAVGALAASAIPLIAWYAHLYQLHGDFFWLVQSTFLKAKLGGGATGTIRAFTGAFEYAWMLAQSYWPWLPFLLIGLWFTIRRGEKRFALPLIWIIVMYAACSVAGSRVLRYLLPAYPAFSIFTTAGLMRLIPRERIDTAIRWVAPAALVASLGIAIFPPVSMHAGEVRPIAAAAREAAKEGERIAFYDEGQPRFDETGQIQWYGDRTMWILTDSTAFERALAEPISRVWIVDADTYARHFTSKPNAIVARSGHLLCVRLT